MSILIRIINNCKFIFAFIFCSTLIISAQEERKHNIYGFKLDLRGHVGMDVGTLKPNNIYTGIQGTIPYDNKNHIFFMNCVYGYGSNFLFNTKFITTGILGLYTNNNFDTINIRTINLGCGVAIIKHGIVVGFSYTNRESFSIKIGFCP